MAFCLVTECLDASVPAPLPVHMPECPCIYLTELDGCLRAYARGAGWFSAG